MAFDELWKKYGGSDTSSANTTGASQPSRQPAAPAERQTTPPIRREQTAPTPQPAVKRTPSQTKRAGASGMTGVFEGTPQSTPPRTTNRTANRTTARRNQPKFDFDRLRDLPWLDIICIAVTVIGLLAIILNFDTITASIFSFLLPIISNLFALLLVVGILAGAIWIITSRFRNRRNRWW